MLAKIELTASEQDRFWTHVDFTDTCWLWTGAKSLRGYGNWKCRGKSYLAHRIAFQLFELLPEGLELDHLCRVHSCVKHTHLEAVTHLENMRRSRSTYCSQGHPFDAIDSKGGRYCRTCSRAYQRAYYHRRKLLIIGETYV